MSRLVTVFAAAVAGLAACTNDDISGIGASAAPVKGSLDVGGEWTWTNAEEVAFPPFLAVALGVVPEGDLTHGSCQSAGSMTLVQTGSSFQGSATRTSNSCFTDGGQPFLQPGSILAVSGNVAGRSVHFSLAGPTVAPCPHHAVITAFDGTAAMALEGKGRCLLPGHPRSESLIQADPPQTGYSRAIAWAAHR